MSEEGDDQTTYRLRIPTRNNAALYGEAVWRKAEHIVATVEALDGGDETRVRVRVPAGLVMLLEWLAQQESAGASTPPLPAMIEELLVEYQERLLDELARGEHPVLRVMAEKAGTWSPPAPVISTDVDDELPF